MRRRQDSNRPNVPGIPISESISPVQKIEITAEDGNTIEIAVRTPPEEGPFPAIIFLHGGMKESRIEHRIRESKSGALPTRFLAAGYAIVMSTYRTYENNSRDSGPIEDNVAVVEYVKDLPEVDARSVVVFGASGGGRLALELVGLGAQTGLAAIVCGEPTTTLYAEMYPVGMKGPNMEVSRNYQKYYGEENSKILDGKVKKLSCPILIVHSDVHQINIINNKFLIPKIKARERTSKQSCTRG